MRAVLDFYSLREATPLVLLIVLLRAIGSQVVRNDHKSRTWARGVAIAAFIVFALTAAAAAAPRTPADVLFLCIRALLAMGTANGVALVALPVGSFLFRRFIAEPRARRRAAEEERTKAAAAADHQRQLAAERAVERDRTDAAKRRQAEEAANRPPPPTREERMTKAKKRFDDLLAALVKTGLDNTELQAAREKAKQQYLRDLDEVMR